MSEINGVTQVIHNPLDLPPEVFNEGMDRRETNRNALLHWIAGALKEKTDYGRPVGKKDSLYKPGAEKILVKLGLKPTFPNLHRYEEAGSSGVDIENIVLECQIVTSDDYVVGHGVGGRQVSKERGDLNKALKMAKKSAMIDATLTCCGLSEMFSQDLEDMDPKIFEKDNGSGFSRKQKATTKPVTNGSVLGSKVGKLPKKSATPIESYTKPQIIDFIIKVGKKVSDYNEYRSHCIGDRSLESLKKDELVSFYKDLRDRS